MQARSKKKYAYTDSQGNPIPEDDKEAMADLASGNTIISYHEQKAEENKDKLISAVRKYKGVSWSDLI